MTLKDYTKTAGVDESSLFMSTQLRKQLATLSQTMEISKMDQDKLAGFLGHDIRVHRNIYHQPIDVIQKARVAKVLLQVNQGIAITDEASLDITNEKTDPDDEESGVETDDEEEQVGDLDDGEPVVTLGETNPFVEVVNPQIQPASTVSPRSVVNPKKTHKSSVLNTAQKPKPGSRSSAGPRGKRPWTADEVAAVRKHLSQCIIMDKVPKKHEAEKNVCI